MTQCEALCLLAGASGSTGGTGASGQTGLTGGFKVCLFIQMHQAWQGLSAFDRQEKKYDTM